MFEVKRRRMGSHGVGSNFEITCLLTVVVLSE